jgi:hypothetical protein
MNIAAFELCDFIREMARGAYGARPNCGLWQSKRFALCQRSEGHTQLEGVLDTTSPGQGPPIILDAERTTDSSRI